MKKHTMLTLEKRQLIEKLYNADYSADEIAKQIGANRSTIYAELKRGADGTFDKNMRYKYSAVLAQKKATKALKRRERKREAAQLAEVGNED